MSSMARAMARWRSPTVRAAALRRKDLNFANTFSMGLKPGEELRIQSEGRPVRVFYAFDPRRLAILLIGGDKSGDDRFYERMIPIADELYDVHLKALKQEGLLK